MSRSAEYDYKSLDEILPHNNELDKEALDKLVQLIASKPKPTDSETLDIINDAIYYQGGTVASALVNTIYTQHQLNKKESKGGKLKRLN